MCKIPKLFELMKERNIKPAKLAAATNTSTGNISDWRSGRSSPSSEKLITLANFFNVSADYLLGLNSLNENETRMLKAFKELSRDEQMIEIGRLEALAEKEKNTEAV